LGNVKAYIFPLLSWLFGLQVMQAQESQLKAADQYPPFELSMADSLFEARAFEQANSELEQAIAIFRNADDKRLLIAALELKARNYRRLPGKDYPDAFPFIEEAASLARQYLSTEDLLMARVYFTLAQFNYRTYGFFDARALMDTTLELYKGASTIDGELYDDIVDYKYYTYSYSNGSTDTLLTYVNLRYQKELDKKERNESEILYILQDFPDMYIDIGDYERALTYAIQGFRYAQENKEEILGEYDGFEVYANSFKNLMDVLLYRKDYEEALKTGMRLLDAIEEEKISIEDYEEYYAVIGNIGLIYSRMENYDQALDYLERSLAIGTKEPIKAVFYGKMLFNIGNCLINTGKAAEGFEYYRNGLEILKREIAMPSTVLHQPFNDIGDYYFQSKELQQALLNYDSALFNSLPNNDKPWYEFPSDSAQDLSLDQITTVARKASLFNQVSIDSIDQEVLREYGLRYADNIHEILLRRRREFEATEGKLFLSEEFRFVYEAAIETAYQLYETKPSDDHFFEALKFARLSKSILFLEQSAEYEKVNNNIINQELKQSFSTYKKRLDQLEGVFYTLIDNNVTSDSIVSLNDSLLVLRANLASVLDTIGQELASANWSGFDKLFAENITQIDVAKGALQLEYFYGEQFIYLLASGNQKQFFQRIKRDDHFEKALIETLAYIVSPPTIGTFKEDQKDFGINAHFLYEQLLAPVLNEIDGIEKLVIIPDQYLSRLPFEVLLSSFDEEDNGQLSFLIHKYAMRYELSSLKIAQQQAKTATKKVLGLGFSNDQSIAGFTRLPGTEKEINFLKASYEGTFINSASKDQFIDLSKDYDIIHLAVHGESDTLNKYDSRLIFSSGDERELKTSDLYLAGLNARLAILSACESGIGEVNKGEGTFSIARGFALSGVPSVVMSLWKVNDKVTSKLMESMYSSFIDEGKTINESLDEAKQNHLKNADMYFSHPFYWASFVHLGEDMHYEKDKEHYVVYGLLAALLLLSLVMIKKRKRTN